MNNGNVNCELKKVDSVSDLGVRFDIKLAILNHMNKKLTKLIVIWVSSKEILYVWTKTLLFYCIRQW